jgi:hypothetical protein
VTGGTRILVLAVFGLVAFVVSTIAAAGGYGSYLPASLLFPFSMLLAGSTGSISERAVALALAQYPLYGWVLSRARSQGSSRHARFFLAMLHCVAAYASVAAMPDGPF